MSELFSQYPCRTEREREEGTATVNVQIKSQVTLMSARTSRLSNIIKNLLIPSLNEIFSLILSFSINVDSFLTQYFLEGERISPSALLWLSVVDWAAASLVALTMPWRQQWNSSGMGITGGVWSYRPSGLTALSGWKKVHITHTYTEHVMSAL